MIEINDVPIYYDIFEKVYSQLFDFYIKFIPTRIDKNKIKPLVSIYDLICQDFCVKKEFSIYSSIIDFTKGWDD